MARVHFVIGLVVLWAGVLGDDSAPNRLLRKATVRRSDDFLDILATDLIADGSVTEFLGDLVHSQISADVTADATSKTRRTCTMSVEASFHPVLTRAQFADLVEPTKSLLRLARENGVLLLPSNAFTIGVYRHGGQIPWDDDVDVFFDVSNTTKIRDKIFPAMKALHGVECKAETPEYMHCPPYIEMFAIAVNEESVDTLKSYWMLPHSIPRNYVFPLIHKKWHGEEVALWRDYPRIFNELFFVEGREKDFNTETWDETMAQAAIGHSHHGKQVCDTCEKCPMAVPVERISYLSKYDPVDYLSTLPFCPAEGQC